MLPINAKGALGVQAAARADSDKRRRPGMRGLAAVSSKTSSTSPSSKTSSASPSSLCCHFGVGHAGHRGHLGWAQVRDEGHGLLTASARYIDELLIGLLLRVKNSFIFIGRSTPLYPRSLAQAPSRAKKRRLKIHRPPAALLASLGSTCRPGYRCLPA